jgi:hypothetical protein
MKANIGERVLYQFDEETAQRVNDEIESRNNVFRRQCSKIGGNSVQCGQVCAAIITRVHGSGCSQVNLKLILDAPFDLWLENISQWNGNSGQSTNKWRWPLES